jgi:hypothetical protein
MARAGDSAGVDPQELYSLAEAIFAYIDEISAVTAAGYTFEQSLAMRERQEQARRLIEALLAAVASCARRCARRPPRSGPRYRWSARRSPRNGRAWRSTRSIPSGS